MMYAALAGKKVNGAGKKVNAIDAVRATVS
jgi:hypothetical protein